MKSHHKTHRAKRPRRGQIAWKLLYIRVCVRLMGWIMPPHSMHVCFIFCVRRWRAAGRIVCCAMRNNGFLMKMCVRVCTPYQNLLLSISLRKATISWGLLLTGNWIFPRLSGALNWKYAKLMLVLPQRLYLVAIFRFQKSDCAKEQVNFNRQRLIWCYFWQQITNFVDQCKILETYFSITLTNLIFQHNIFMSSSVHYFQILSRIKNLNDTYLYYWMYNQKLTACSQNQRALSSVQNWN